MNINDLIPGQKIECYVLVKYKNPIKEYRNKTGFWFSIGGMFGGKEIIVKYWGGENKAKVEENFQSFKENDFIFVSGIVDEYKGEMSINVDETSGIIRKCNEDEISEASEEILLKLPKTNQDVDKIFNEILNEVNAIENEYLKKLLKEFFNDADFVEKFKTHPASKMYHQACIGGFIEHVWGVIKICKTMCEIHPSLNKDLLITGAILHDIGKLKEIEVKNGFFDSEIGFLRGHISLGEEMVIEKIKNLENNGLINNKFPEILKAKILHLIISHHGTKEFGFGSPMSPKFPEAAALFLADFLDARITQYIRGKKDNLSTNPDVFKTTYLKRPPIGEIYLK